MSTIENASGSVFSASRWLNNHFSIKSRGRFLYVSSLPLRRGDHVLDFGCANGSWTRLLAEMVGESGRVVGIDRDGALIGEAWKSVAETHLANRVSFHSLSKPDLSAVPYDRYDVVTAFNVLSYIEDPSDTLSIFRDAISQKNGRMILKDSAISADFFWPLPNILANEIRCRTIGGGRIRTYDPNFALNCRALIERTGFSIAETLLNSYPFIFPFTEAEQAYISQNAAMILRMPFQQKPSSELTQWAREAMIPGGTFFNDSQSIYTTTEFTYICHPKLRIH